MTLAIMLILLCAATWSLAASSVPPPISWEGLKELSPVILIALLGGLVAFVGKVRAGEARPFNIVEFIGEMFVSAVSGVLFYWICRGFDINPWITAAIIGISGHAGSRGMFMLEKWGERKLEELKLIK